MAESHEKIRMQIEPISGQRRFFRASSAAYPRVPLDHRDLETGARKIGGKRQAVVTRADDNSIVGRHLRSIPARWKSDASGSCQKRPFRDAWSCFMLFVEYRNFKREKLCSARMI